MPFFSRRASGLINAKVRWTLPLGLPPGTLGTTKSGKKNASSLQKN